MCSQQNQDGQSRKRRRQAIVCTECRRRKIACDRNSPCAQCIQSNSACTYYTSYNSFPKADCTDVHDNSKKHHPNPSPASQGLLDLGSRPPLPSLPCNYPNPSHGAADVGAVLTTTMSADAEMQSSFDTRNFGPLSLPISMSIDPTNIPFPDNSTMGIMGLDGPSDVTNLTLKASFQPRSILPQSNRVVFHKSRLYSLSHWMSILERYEQHGLFDNIRNTVFYGTTNHPGLQKCKRLAQGLKELSGPDPQLLSRPLQEFIPPRETSDRLVNLYLRTFESVFRILHIPTFQREYAGYWRNPQAASELLVLQILLVMAIGTCFYQDTLSDNTDRFPTLHIQPMQWIHVAQLKLTAPYRKKHLNLRGVQTQCLLVFAFMTNTNAVGGDLTWVTTASLLQTGMAIGLHLEPSQLSTSPLETEIRLRLWATMLELAVQAALDSGLPPLISAEALDSCEPPSNLDDSQIKETTKIRPASQPTGTFTQTSIQCALLRSLPIRLKIAEALGQLRSELPYESAQSLGAELTAALRETSELIDSYHPAPSAFQIQLQDLLQRRFLLILHAQFAHKASDNVKYHFSRTVSLECALLLLPPQRSSTSNESQDGHNSTDSGSSPDDFTTLRIYGDGLFKNVFLAATVTLCAEFLLQLREDSSPGTSSRLRQELLHAIENAAALTRHRILKGETSVKAHVFLVCVLATIGASRRRSLSQNKQQANQVVADAAKSALDGCYGVLEARLQRMTDVKNLGSSFDLLPKSTVDSNGLLNSESSKEDELGRIITGHRLEGSTDPSPLLDDGSDAWSLSVWDNEITFA